MTGRKKLWCFMQAFSYPITIVSLLGLLTVPIMLGYWTIAFGAAIIISTIVALIIAALILGSMLEALIECYEDYRFMVGRRNDNS